MSPHKYAWWCLNFLGNNLLSNQSLWVF
uniref:Uncharacterized protein n=1 Tax=Anguilla anguilla TaxID=7936 RepID=A0A0E9P7C6_ANGAN